jgi:hypothetical protein
LPRNAAADSDIESGQDITLGDDALALRRAVGTEVAFTTTCDAVRPPRHADKALDPAAFEADVLRGHYHSDLELKKYHPADVVEFRLRRTARERE